MLVSSWIRCDGMVRCIRRVIARARNGLCQPPPIVALKRTIVAYEVCKVFEYKHNLQVFSQYRRSRSLPMQGSVASGGHSGRTRAACDHKRNEALVGFRGGGSGGVALKPGL